jgi:hypothetical protein
VCSVFLKKCLFGEKSSQFGTDLKASVVLNIPFHDDSYCSLRVSAASR